MGMVFSELVGKLLTSKGVSSPEEVNKACSELKDKLSAMSRVDAVAVEILGLFGYEQSNAEWKDSVKRELDLVNSLLVAEKTGRDDIICLDHILFLIPIIGALVDDLLLRKHLQDLESRGFHPGRGTPLPNRAHSPFALDELNQVTDWVLTVLKSRQLIYSEKKELLTLEDFRRFMKVRDRILRNEGWSTEDLGISPSECNSYEAVKWAYWEMRSL